MRKVTRFCCVLAFLGCLAGGSTVLAADAMTSLETERELKEMPVMTGEQWQTMQPESKMAFVWGMGHVVTIEEHVLQRHPELQRKGFVAKLAEGLRGVPMNSIIRQVDDYYRKNPDDLDLPVMRVIWSQMVKPKLASGIADRPINRQESDH
jgi:hypothetical protein